MNLIKKEFQNNLFKPVDKIMQCRNVTQNSPN